MAALNPPAPHAGQTPPYRPTFRVVSSSNWLQNGVADGTADADHPRKLDESIVKWLNQNGAKAGDRGIVSAMAT
jgi:hypothetical protein